MLFTVSIFYLVTFSFGLNFIPEDFNSLRTINYAWPLYETFYPLLTDTIYFSVHAGHDAWIGLTTVNLHNAPKYEVLFGADSNTNVQILKNRNVLAVTKLKVLDPFAHKGFWIKLENRYKPNLKISIGNEGETTPFLKIKEYKHINISYFSIATTGEDKFGLWQLKGIDKESGKLGHIKVTSVTTISTLEPTYDKFYDISDNVLRLFIKAPHSAHVVLMPNKRISPNYKIVFGAYNNEAIVLYKSGKKLKSFYNTILDDSKYIGFWISVTRNITKSTIISIGNLDSVNPLLSYVDKYGSEFDVKYFSISTSSDYLTPKNGYWRLLL